MAFIGFQEDFDKYKSESQANTTGTGNKISYSDMPDISEEDLKIITESRTRHDCYSVYMQSDESFYDDYYNMESDIEETDAIDKELIEEVKGIRRIYKNFFSYDYAMKIRHKYIDALVEKYGGEDMFRLYLDSGLVRDWLPPIPIYATTSEDYKYFIEGKFNIPGEWDDDLAESTIKSYLDKLSNDVDIDDIKIIGDVLTDPLLLMETYMTQAVSRANSNIRRSNNTSFGEISAYDVSEMEKLIKSWIDPENQNEQVISVDSTDKSNFYDMTEEAIRARYFGGSSIKTEGLAKAIEIGYFEEPEEDMNEMVIDPDTKRPMSRGELKTRQMIRFMASGGWNELRLMQKFGIGSTFELKTMEQQRRRRKSAKKKASSFIGDIIGMDPSEVNSLDELDNILFDN